MSPGFILVHGYTGCGTELTPLAEALARRYGARCVQAIKLAGHGGSACPAFDEERFITQILGAIESFREQGRVIVLIGHSTGGVLVLKSVAGSTVSPALVVLAATPFRVDGDYFDRWSKHAAGAAVPLADLARMIRAINGVTAPQRLAGGRRFVLHGAEDRLVPAAESALWLADGGAGSCRCAVVPGAGHDLFGGAAGALAVDLVCRAVADALAEADQEHLATAQRLAQAEPPAAEFLRASPMSLRHLCLCPSGRRFAGLAPEFAPQAATEPVFANIEVTTYCNLACPACARTQRGGASRHMPRRQFQAVLDLLPHAYRVTLVGLGEPLLHPQIDALVADAVQRRRRVGIVTNASTLDRQMSRALLSAGVHAMTFSLDTVEPSLAASLRPNVPIARILSNIRTYLEEAEVHAARDGPAPTAAAFCALSIDNAESLDALLEELSDLGLKAAMLSDLNFQSNGPRTLWQAASPQNRASIRQTVKRWIPRGLMVLSVRGLEDFALAQRYRDALLMPPDMLWRRSPRHAFCASPWQTIPVSVDGQASLCDCQPEVLLGNLLEVPLSEIWNGPTMVDHRRRMCGQCPPPPCLLCPRF
jgi:MoaA/NifB/PqqE/SkfB family radical SAM enzyme/pimeloyl-ACP methyl ester carboxylesterase